MSNNNNNDISFESYKNLNKLWSKKMTVIPIVVGALGQEKLKIRKRIETMQTTKLLTSARILLRALKT